MDLVSSLSSSLESSSQVEPGTDRKSTGYETLMVTSEDGITKIMLNRPTKKNALNVEVMLPALGVCPVFLFFFYVFHAKAVEFQHHSYFMVCLV